MYINFNNQGEFNLSLTNKPADIFGFTNCIIREGGSFDAQLANFGIVPTTDALNFVKKQVTDSGFITEYNLTEKNLSVFCNVKTYKEINIVSQYTIVKNTGNIRYITQLCSANINEICYDENLEKRLSDGSILIHICQSKWQGEGQWIKRTPNELGLYVCNSHSWEREFYRFDSISSWSTGEYYPIIIIEDKKRNECWFFEIESGHDWFFEIYVCRGIKTKFLSIKTGTADERLGNIITLDNKNSATSCKTVYGITRGGFEEAIKQLLKYKRLVSESTHDVPVVFNDYMNCNWANESERTLIRLIDKAKEVGADIFCIDDGWQIFQGLWYPDDKKFGKNGFKGIIDYIISKGMTAGVWFEFETIPYELIEKLGTDEIILKRNSYTVAPHRPLANMRSSVLLNYLNERVDALYDLGVRFIKNDHNNTEFTGSTNYGELPAYGLEKNNEYFIKFIEGIKHRHPDLIIENCGSGAMRSDNDTLKHFDLQSTSDQENYRLNPSIVGGTLALMPPEKAGIWCYPYPLSFDERDMDMPPEKTFKAAIDGEQTIFNFTTSLLGKTYLSGRIDCADENNTNLIKEGVALSKKLSNYIKTGYPVFPKGTIRLNCSTDYALGITDENYNTMILAVWNLSERPRTVTVDMSKYCLKTAKIIYPEKQYEIPFTFNEKNLACKFLKGVSARLFLLEK